MDESFRKYLSLLWHWAWLIGLGIVVAGGWAFISSRLTPPVYTAATTMLINEASGNSAQADPASILIKSDRLGQTYSAMMVQQPVLDKVIESLGLNLSTGQLARAVQVSIVKDTQLLRLTVESEDPAQAAAIANTLPAVFRQQNADIQAERYADAKVNLVQQMDAVAAQIDQNQADITTVTRSAGLQKESDLLRLQSELAQLRQTYDRLALSFENIRLAEAQSSNNVVVTEAASVPTEPIRPRPLTDTLQGAMLGLILAVGAIFAMDYLNNTIRTPEQVGAQLKLPVIGLIARTNGNHKARGWSAVRSWRAADKWRTSNSEPEVRGLIAIQEPRSPVTEAFRVLRTNIQIAGVDQPIRTLLVTSPGPTEGKSTVAANLAVVMAQAGRDVVLLDADLRRPRVHVIFGQPQEPGLTEALLDDNRQWARVSVSTGIDHLTTVPSGGLPPNPSELLGSMRMQEFIGHLNGLSGTIILDTPPLLPVTDALVLAPNVDGVIVVIEHGVTQLRAAQQTVEQLHQAGARVLGVVLNQVPTGRGGYGYYYRHYYAEHESVVSTAKPKRSKTLERSAEIRPETGPAGK